MASSPLPTQGIYSRFDPEVVVEYDAVASDKGALPVIDETVMGEGPQQHTLVIYMDTCRTVPWISGRANVSTMIYASREARDGTPP
jgi:hypothetical protein